MQHLQPYNYFVKGDISGIQDFIFSVPSDGAAKSLKARSYFVLALSKLCLRILEIKLGAGNLHLVYDGGGNFYAFAKAGDEEIFADIQKNLSEALAQDNLYLALSFCKFKADRDLSAFGDLLGKINALSEENKKKAYQTWFNTFIPFNRPDSKSLQWANFTDAFKRANSIEYITPQNRQRRVDETGIVLLGEQLRLSDRGNAFSKDIVNKLPLWDKEGKIEKKYANSIERIREEQIGTENTTVIKPNGIIPFEHLAKFAWERTGADKLGILKMDVDNLGEQFRQIGQYQDFQTLSERLSHFFSEKMLEVLDAKFGDDTFRNNIYPVFSGGDDCFFVGGWDAVFAFSLHVRRSFEGIFGQEITLSASLTMTDSKFPVARFAQLAEEGLSKAKNLLDEDGLKPKNRIAVFGEVLTWNDFEHAQRWAIDLERFVRADRLPKRILWRLQRAQTGYNSLLERAGNRGQIINSKVWRLAWYLRAGTKSDDLEIQEFIQKIMEECTDALLNNHFRHPPGLSPAVFTVAGRWAEFSTRNAN